MSEYHLIRQKADLNASLNGAQPLIGLLRRELHHGPCSIRGEISPRELSWNDVASLERYDSTFRGLAEDQYFS